MNYCEQYFGKLLQDLNYDDITAFFQEEKEENENLEFKSGSLELTDATFNTVLETKITRTIASFLNSSGGMLIWGSPRERSIPDKNEKVCQGDLNTLNISRTKDQLINKITRDISYLPIGINVKRLERGGQYIYVFEIEESETKPHQYLGKYFIRLDGQTQHAPHYLVDALFKRVTYPELFAEVEFISSNLHGRKAADIQISISNNSRFLNAKNVSYTINTNLGSFGFDGGKTEVFSFNSILPKGMINRKDHKLLYPRNLENKDIVITIQFYSENSPLKISTYVLNVDPVTTIITHRKITENMDAHVAMEMLNDAQFDSE